MGDWRRAPLPRVFGSAPHPARSWRSDSALLSREEEAASARETKAGPAAMPPKHTEASVALHRMQAAMLRSDRPLPPAPTLPDRSRYAASMGRRGFLAGAAALAAGQALAQAPAGVPDGRPFRFFFEPEPGSTLAYEVTEAERQSGPPASSYLRGATR